MVSDLTTVPLPSARLISMLLTFIVSAVRKLPASVDLVFTPDNPANDTDIDFVPLLSGTGDSSSSLQANKVEAANNAINKFLIFITLLKLMINTLCGSLSFLPVISGLFCSG